MTQAILTVQPVPVVDAGEPTMEQLAASLPEPTADTTTETAAEAQAILDAPVVDPAAEPTAEPAVEESADAKATPEQAADVDRLDRASKAAAKAREGSRRYAETQRQIAEQNARMQAAAREAETLRAETAAARQREADYQKDPYAALKARGMTDVELAQRALRENTPEAITAKLADDLKAERSARLALEQKLELQQRAAAAAAAESDFLAEAKDVEAYPELAVRRPQAKLVAAREALKQIQANGYSTAHFSNAQIAEAADKWLAADETVARPAKAKAAAVEPARPIAKPSGKTLTNAQATTRTVAPSAWDTLTEEQQLAHMAASLPDPV